MKFKSFKIIVLLFFVLLTSGFIKPKPAQALCLVTGYGFPSKITAFSINLLSNDLLSTNGTFTKGGECMSNGMYREGEPAVSITSTILGASTIMAGCISNCVYSPNIDTSSLANGTYTAVFSVTDTWGGAVPSSATFTINRPPPVVSITASPNPVAYNGQATLTWSSTGATSCTASGPWTNSGTLNGSGWTNPLTAATTFTFQCTGLGGTSIPQSVTVGADPSPTPVVNILASPTPIIAGNSSTISWNTSFVKNCTAAGAWSGVKLLAGSESTGVMSVPGNYVYTLNCRDVSLGVAVFGDASLTVLSPVPTASLTVSPSPVAYNGQPTLTWSSTNATSCIAGGPWTNSGTLNGSGWTNPLTTNTTFTFQCSGPGGTSPLQSATVVVNPPAAPTASLSASPLAVAYNGQPTLTWSSTNATSCTAGGPWSNASNPLGNPISGSGWTNPLTTNTTFTFQCSGPGGTTALQSVTVTVGAAPISGVCGSANGVTYTYGAINYTPYSQCSSGSPSSTAFPLAGSSISWTCSGTNGGPSSGSCSASQSAPVPSVSVVASPTSVPLGGASTISWLSTNTTSCTASGTDAAWLGGKALSGSQFFSSLTAGLHTYTLGCSGPGGSGSGSATVNVATFACGNGICETGENLLTCPTDCKIKVEQF